MNDITPRRGSDLLPRTLISGNLDHSNKTFLFKFKKNSSIKRKQFDNVY